MTRAVAKVSAVARGREELAAAIQRASVAVQGARIGLGAGSSALQDLATLTGGLLGAVEDSHTPERMTTATDLLGDGWPAEMAVALAVFLEPMDSRHRPSSVAVEDLARANQAQFVREIPNVPNDTRSLRAWIDSRLRAAARLAADNEDDFYFTRLRAARRFMASFDPLAPMFLAD